MTTVDPAPQPSPTASPAHRDRPGRQPQAKATVAELGVDIATLHWQRSGSGEGAVEVAMTIVAQQPWVLLRVAGDPSGLVLAYDRHEWDCFIDGVHRGEFDTPQK